MLTAQSIIIFASWKILKLPKVLAQQQNVYVTYMGMRDQRI
ncbi:hypothetical protein NIES4106_01400 [Fischerella sp. NIES-4106]|nr:hypothetical protein NIES4106_01400 [Fischerella sp. NIES-4106]